MDDQTAVPTLLTVSLWVWLLDALAFGVFILAAPSFVVETLGDDASFGYWWVRWSGGILLGLAVGTWMVIRSPRGNGAFVLASGLAAFLAGIGLVWGFLADEYGGAAWFLWLTLASSLGVGALILYAWSRSRAVLSSSSGGM